MPTEEPFRVLLRRDNAYEAAVTLRFNVTDGMGQLAVKLGGRGEPPMAVHYEETGIDPDILRAARFVYNLNQQRQSFALSRLTPDLCARLSSEQWTELRPVIEFGFRYLVIPEEALVAAPAPVQIQVSASAGASASVSAPAAPPGRVAAAVRVSEPLAPPTPPHGLTGGEPETRRPVPMEPGLAAAALDALTREAAVGHLRSQLASVEALHQRIEQLERKVASSRARERDLLAVLSRWQERDSEAP